MLLKNLRLSYRRRPTFNNLKNIISSISLPAVGVAMLRTLSNATPTRRRKSTPRLDQTPSISSNSDRDRERRISSPRLLRQISNPSEFFKKMSPSRSRDKMNPALRTALNLLELPDLDALEEHFIKTPVFLVPWADYRDSFLLIQPNGMPRSARPGQISRRDILYAYTYFCEGKLRYDGRADIENMKEYNPDLKPSEYYAIKKKYWGAAEYDKLLYVWLLQIFKVGKQRNPFGFRYFECLNICRAWEEVFVPIVEAVRNDYNTKGRYHYGRLAKVVEEHAPSRLAFPEGNVTSDTQFFRSSVPTSESSAHRALGEMHPVTGIATEWKKWQEEEAELRRAYPQYGQLVERLKPKTNFPDWIEEQRLMVEKRKQEERAAENRSAALRYLEGGEVNFSDSPSASHVSHEDVFVDRPYKSRVREAHDSDSFMRRTISPLSYHMHQRQISAQSNTSTAGTNPPIRRSSLRNLRERGCADVTYAEARSSIDPSPEQSTPANKYQQAYIDLAAHPYDTESTIDHRSSNGATPSHYCDDDVARHPSYEGTGYASPYLPTLKEADSRETVDREAILQQLELDPHLGLDPFSREYHLEHALRTVKLQSEPEQPTLQHVKSFEKTCTATRIPSPINIPPLPTETVREYHLVADQATETSPTSLGLPASNGSPAIPPKNPLRYSDVKEKKRNNQTRSQFDEPIKPIDIQASRLVAEEVQMTNSLRGRIISKENIRAALDIPEEEFAVAEGEHLIPSSPTLPSSPTSPVSAGFRQGFAGIGGRGLNTGESPKLQTFSSHMFPRSSSSLRRPPTRGSKGSYEIEG